ncbi:signal peptide peptidase [Obelidium mucronatum]|nr:signal peptide peptidase [Obelidium mucronatum]
MSDDNSGLFLAYAAIGVMALIPIYVGSYASLKYPKKKGETSDDDDDEETPEFFSFDDAKWYPVVGSVTLLSLYLILKFVSKEYINLVLTLNFTVIGFFSVYEVVLDAARFCSGLALRGDYVCLLINDAAAGKDKKGKKKNHELFKFRFGITHTLLAALALATTIAYYTSQKHWILSNVFALSLSITTMKLLHLDSFATGITLLTGLFFYDIFWVFGTEVMVSVAKGLDIPIKVTFPKNLTLLINHGILNAPPENSGGFTMLGLGDIVIPGIFIALCLSYDHHNYLKSTAGKRNKQSRWFPTPYFTTCFVMYIVGLATTVYVMHTFKAAQPALLYLSPACILSAVGVALVRGDFKALFDFAPQGSLLHESKQKKKSKSKNTADHGAVKTESDIKFEADDETSVEEKGRRVRSKSNGTSKTRKRQLSSRSK